jgi:putative membrane protein (TIGR04086 family)
LQSKIIRDEAVKALNEGVAMMKTVPEKQPVSVSQLFMPELFGILGAFIVSVLLLAVFSAIMAARDVPSSMIMPFACVSISLGSLCGGFMASRLYRSHGFLLGLVTGLLFYVILYMIGAIMHQADLNALLLLKIILSVLFGAVGGIIGVNFKRRRSKI